MIRIISLYGIIAGLIVGVPMVALMVILTPQGQMENGVVYGYVTMILALSIVFLGIKHHRDKMLGGAIKFGPAFLIGLGISAVASVIYALAWEISLALTGFDFAQTYSSMMIEAARAKGASPEEILKATQKAESFVKMYANPFYRLPITFAEMFPVGALISLIAAAVLRNPRVLAARAAA